MTPDLEILKRNAHKFRKKEQDNGCIHFNGYLQPNGYGHFQFRDGGIRYKTYAHRASFSIENGIELTESDVILHQCDNPTCVNPAHLKLGTQQENIADRVAKGRCAKGPRKGKMGKGIYFPCK